MVMAYRQPPWIAAVYKDGKKCYLGKFETKEEAEKVEDRFRTRHDLPKTQKEIAAKAHATLRNLGLYRNQHTIRRTDLT